MNRNIFFSIRDNILKICEKGIILLLFITLNGCVNGNNLTLTPKSSENPTILSEDSFCIVEPGQEDGNHIKIMFVVDISGSNVRWGRNDIDGSKRADNIDRFVDNLDRQNKEAYQYGLILFNHAATATINYDGDGSKPRYTSDLNEVKEATQQIRNNPGNGGTEYGFAVALAQQAILYDINQFPNERSEYVVFFISDGEPNDSEILTPVISLINQVDITGRSVYLSTAYYGSGGEGAINNLEDMANEGKGSFVNFENSESWDFTQLITKANDVIPWSLKEFLVYNINAGFCMDGKVDVDSDADGMCDRDEIAMNKLYAAELREEGISFDPANRFSFGDGYGDFFHWLRFKYQGKSLVPCEDRTDEDFDLLTTCEENEIENRLNSQNIFQKGDPKVFDTDKDGVLDGIETFVYFASQSAGRATRYTAALDSDNLSDNPDGEESVLVQIKQHRNPLFPDPEAEAYDTSVVPIFDNPTGDCYLFSQSNLPVYKTLEIKEGNTLAGLEHPAGENAVMVYYIQVPQSSPRSLGVLKHSIQKLRWDEPLNTGLQLKETFKEYIPPLR